MSGRSLIATLLLVTGACAHSSTENLATLVVDVQSAGEERCVVHAKDKTWSFDDMRAWRPKYRAVVNANPNTPWKCIAEAVYNLQRAGFRPVDTRFIAEPNIEPAIQRP